VRRLCEIYEVSSLEDLLMIPFLAGPPRTRMSPSLALVPPSGDQKLWGRFKKSERPPTDEEVLGEHFSKAKTSRPPPMFSKAPYRT
jgi:hypothetical protein